MNATESRSSQQRPIVDQETFIREIASLRSYLAVVAAMLNGIRRLGVSDIVDSVLLDAFDRVRQGEPDFSYRSNEELRAWLVNRLKWTYQDRLKRRQRYGEILSGLAPPALPRTPSSDAAYNERAGQVRATLSRLDPADREIIEGRVFEGLTYEEIGRKRGYSASYARRAWLAAKSRFESVYRGKGKALSLEASRQRRTRPPGVPNEAP
jgi:RNA polymerase sigma factor (sigma-70 family)